MNTPATGILLVVLALIAGIWFFVIKVGDEPAEASDAFWFYKVAEADIETISIKTESVEQSFSLRDNSDWYFTGEQQPPVDMSRWGGVTLVLSGPRARRVLSEEIEDLKTYGLDPPSTVLGLHLRGDRNLTMYLGDLTPDGSGYYATQEDDDNLYVIESVWGKVIRRLASEPPYPSWFYRFDSSRVLYLSVTKDEKTSHFVKDGATVASWRFADADRTPIDPVRWAEIIPLLDGPPSLGILSDTIDDLGKYGLLEPESTIIVEYLPPEGIEGSNWEVLLEVGSPIEDGSGYYAKTTGQPALLTIDVQWYETLERLVDDRPDVADSVPVP
tara:strand:- start:132 stop:1118 length:987 start_codon:yes stop_codon:yes gene_type:complete